MRHVEADQALAQVQHDLFLYEQPPLPPLQLAEAALKSPADASLVFDVLAAAGQDFRLANRSALQKIQISHHPNCQQSPWSCFQDANAMFQADELQ